CDEFEPQRLTGYVRWSLQYRSAVRPAATGWLDSGACRHTTTSASGIEARHAGNSVILPEPPPRSSSSSSICECKGARLGAEAVEVIDWAARYAARWPCGRWPRPNSASAVLMSMRGKTRWMLCGHTLNMGGI